jgi:hypothetical protein
VEELAGFLTTAKLRALTARQKPVSELYLRGQSGAPTVTEGEVSIPKFDVDDLFDHEPFIEMSEVYNILHCLLAIYCFLPHQQKLTSMDA